MLEGYIVLNILVTTESSQQLESLGITGSDNLYEYETHLINIDKIDSIGLGSQEGCIIYVNGNGCYTKETAKEIILKIKKAKENNS